MIADKIDREFFSFYNKTMKDKKWIPLNPEKLKEIEELFFQTYPETEYGDLAPKISRFWVDLLNKSWDEKSPELKKLDLLYDPSDPLSRVEQKTTVITYADSISRKGEDTLKTLDDFMDKWFPSIGGLHILPACTVVEERFNDGYFSQVERNSIHRAFGTNEFFADLAHRYFSMNDLVMGHVDIENPAFKAYLAGDDQAGKTFYTYSEAEYQDLKEAGSFDKVFRPRPFPLFSIFRRVPESVPYDSMPYETRAGVMKNLILEELGVNLDPRTIGILYVFSKVKNDQMLLDEDFAFVSDFIDLLKERQIAPQSLFTKSLTQEVQHVPWIFIPEIDSRARLLEAAGLTPGVAKSVSEVFERENWKIFGEEIRALTTFSHVQVDVNTTTFEGLKRFAEDLVWYLSMDLNMLRLDAVNYAFKKWGTSCFGLPELDRLMKIVYLSMECISPRMVPNLEVNDSLTTILKTMSSGDSAPPMMHDFQLASLLPAVFHAKDPEIIRRIFDKISEYDVPKDSIRFSLSESHDGKSVRGSMDLLTFEERRVLTEAVTANGGYVKYKSIPPRVTSSADLEKFCREGEIEFGKLSETLFGSGGDGGSCELKDDIKGEDDIFRLVPELGEGTLRETARFFFTRILQGRDPYELCISTRNSLPDLCGSEGLEADRFLAFETLAFSVMGRNIKTVYFNDLLGLPNDYGRVEKSGELRDIKRTKTDYEKLLPLLKDEGSFTSKVARGMNTLIGIVDSDPALHFRGHEAQLIALPSGTPVAAVYNHCGKNFSVTLINLSSEAVSAIIPFSGLSSTPADGTVLKDSLSESEVIVKDGGAAVEIRPFGRMWLKKQ